MSHLPSDRLAAFVDESPSAEELAHLAACPECARERAMYLSLADLSTAASARIGAPLTSWESLRPALLADGVIDRGRGLELRARRVSRPWLQAAAAVLLVAGGAMAGRYSANRTIFANGSDSVTPTAAPVAAVVDTATPTFASVDDARAARDRYQVLYQNAMAFIAQEQDSTPTTTAAAKRVRLAALDRANQVFSEAMNEAPDDPVITGAYLTTAGQREATLRQLATIAPASMRINSY